MIRIAALNDSSSECDGDDVRAKAVGTREAEESEAYTLYNKALGLQRQDIQKAEEAFEQLLSHGFIREAAKLVETETVGIIHPGLQLLYSIYKNLAAMSLQKGDHEEAMEWYIEAVKVDESETTVWYKIGTIALKLHNYQLARLGFEQGLQCNPNHWPCLDNIVTVLYTINDYWYCLYYISKALKKDYLYPKGIVFRNQIFKEQPSLKEATKEMFNECNLLIDKENVDQEEIDEFINEALLMRQKRRELARTPPMKPNKLPVPIKSYTWLSLGESLMALYDTIKKSNPPMSMGIRVDLSDYAAEKSKNSDAQNEEKQSPSANSMSSAEVPQAEDKADVSKPEEMEVDLPTEPAADVISVSAVGTISTDTVSDTAVIGTSVSNTSTSDTAVSTVVSSSDSAVTVGCNESTAVSEVVFSVASVTVTSEREIFTSISPVTSGPSTPDVSTSFAPMSSIPVSVTTALLDLPSSETSDTEGKVKGQKRKRSSNFENPYYEKRRSARVRNTFTRREEERVNFREILETFIPSSLRSGIDEEEMESLDLVSEKEESVFSRPNKTENGKGLDGKLISATEGTDVREFLVREQKNGGVLMLMLHFLEALCDRSELVWPQELVSVYVRMYTRWRRHIDLPCLLSYDEPEEDIRSFGKMVLLKLEFQFDQWLTKHLKSGASPKGKSPGSALPSDLPKFWEEDMDYVFGLQGQSQVLGALWLQHCIRAYWLQARLCLLQGEIQYASCSFHKAKEFLRWRIEDENVPEMRLQNCHSDNWISLESIERHQDSLQRSQSMDEMQKLYEAKDYDKVVALLLKAVTQPSQKPVKKNSDSVIPTRIEQLCLLQDCLFKMGDVQGSMQWSEVAFHETFQGYKKAKTSPQKDEWSNVLNQIWSSCLQNLEKPESLRELTGPRKIRLTSDLLSVIDIMMSVPEKATDMPIGSVLPWMILYSVINFEEEKFFAMQQEQESQASGDSLPSSLMLLSVSHEYLGSHSWCTKSNGKFLIFFLEILQKKMRHSYKYTDDLRQMYEQCVYCLYGHPNKKGKARHLQDHNVTPVSLTLQQAIQLFDYFKPKNLPEFDSFKTDTVSAEVETLLRKIVPFIPEKEKPANRLDKVHDFIDGSSSVAPSAAEGIEFSPITQEIYYLLADYYFKNNEHPKAIKFYMHDICVCPQRLDSWAGLALARMSQLEQKLNSTDLKLDVSLQKRSRAALRCFERAVDIEDAYGKLWMEYGSLSYQLHAHSSRQLNFNQEKKVECDEDFLHCDLQQLASTFKVEMLELAYMCYKSASQCVDEESEEWLTDYMMGKCLEKMKNKSPKQYLDYYRQAAAALHEENATYPKKITYAYTAHTSPRLAVEALEMFYRLHVSVLKLLMKGTHSEEYHVFADYIDEAANSPFAKGCEKKDEESGNVSMDYDDTKQDKSTTNQQDHTYSKLKEATSMMENVDKGKGGNVDSADSMDEKNEDSANNSMDSSEYFPSAEPSESSQDVVGAMETEDSMQTFSANSFRDQESFQLPQTMELSAEELDSGDKVPAVEERATTDFDNRDPLSKQKSLGFVPSEMVEESRLQSNLNVTIASESVMTKTDVIEIFSSPEPVDPGARPKFFLPNDQPSAVSEKSGEEILVSCSVQSAEDRDSVVRSDEHTAGDVRDTKTMEDVQTRDHQRDTEAEIGSIKPTEDKSVTSTAIEGNEEKPSGGLMETETLNASKEIPSSPFDKASIVEESTSACVKIESPITRPDEGHTEGEGRCQNDGVKIETSNTGLLPKGGSEHAEEQLTTKVEASKPVEKEMSVEQLTTKVESSKPVEKESKPVEQVTTKADSSKPVEKETKPVEQLTMKDETSKPAEKDTKSGEQLTTKDDSSKPVEKGTKSGEQLTTKDDSSKPVEKETKPKLEGTALRKDLIEKCMAALHLCLSRFPTHYKSTYRLASVYFYSPYHKNLQYARDLLLGNPQWQTLSYMPAQGLFSERKVNNFFQGTWRLPISEVERAGSFATHLNRAVLLLLKVLLEQTDVPMLYHLHLQFNRTPDPEKKYLRDAERLHYSRLALEYCLCAIKNRLSQIRELQDSQKAIKLLLETYKIYNYGISKMKTTVGPRIGNLLAATYKAVMKEEVSADKPLLEQAIKMCQLYQQQNTIQRQGAARSNMDASQSDSSLFSPDRSLSNPFRSSGTPQSPVKMFHNNSLPVPQPKSQQSPITSMQGVPSKLQTPQSPLKMSTSSTSSTSRPQQVPPNKPQAPQSPVKMVTSSTSRPQQVPPNKPQAPQSPVKMVTSLTSRPQQQVPLSKLLTPQSPVKMSSTSSTPRPQQGPPNKPSTPRPQQPVIQLTKLQMHVEPQNLPELTKKTPPKEEPQGAAHKVLGQQSKSSDNLPVGPKPSTSGISAISLISSLIEDGISKANKQKMEKERIGSVGDEPLGPLTTPSTPKPYKASPAGPAAGAKRPALQLYHPKKKALRLEEVIEILSSDEDEDLEETVKVSPNTKPSFVKGSETKQQLFTKEEIVQKRTCEVEEQKMEKDVKTSSASLKTDTNESENVNDPHSSMVPVCGEGDSKIGEDKEPGPAKDELSDKEIPYLDPSTGLFVTDSDSQNSVYVANPENISFEDDLMVEDD